MNIRHRNPINRQTSPSRRLTQDPIRLRFLDPTRSKYQGNHAHHGHRALWLEVAIVRRSSPRPIARSEHAS